MNDLVIVTGASSNHFRCLTHLLFTISRFENARTIVYDLGLEPHQLERLKEKWEVRRFPFEKYPPHFDMRVGMGQYAWKPVIVVDTLRETGGNVLWMDAGNLVHRRLDRIRKLLALRGFYSPPSSGTISRWTHPGTLKYLEATPDLLTKPNRNGAVVGFAPSRPGSDELADRWRQGALDVDCIAPAGSSRANHRQDQAVLSVLAYQFQKKYGGKLENRFLDFTTHNDPLGFEDVLWQLRWSRLLPRYRGRSLNPLLRHKSYCVRLLRDMPKLWIQEFRGASNHRR